MRHEAVQRFLSDVKVMLDWAPDWVVPTLLLALAALIAMAIHGLAIRAFRRAVGQDSTYLRSLLKKAKGATRLALVVFAISLVLPLAPLTPGLEATFSVILTVALIVLIGWVALLATNMAADLYIQRFDVEAADNLLARKQITQVRVLRRAAVTLTVVITVGAALMAFEPVRQFGVGLFASAGLAGLVVALAARPVIANVIAGVQIAMTQPIRIDDAVVVDGEWGWIEDITSTYVVIRLWDWRRLIVPLSHFIEKPFQNWTRESAAIIGTVRIHADYTVPVDRVRQKLSEIVKDSPHWDGKVVNLQVTDANDRTIELRALVSAKTSPQAWDLRCHVREMLIAFLQKEYPDALPKVRAELGAERHFQPARGLAPAAG